MKHDKDKDGYLGVTYISHGSDHKKSSPDGSAISVQKSEQEKPTTKQPQKKQPTEGTNESPSIAELQTQLSALEKTLQGYQTQTTDRLDHLERLAGHPISDSERIFRIQEEA